MIKNITTLVKENRKNVLRKSLLLGGAALGLVAGALLAKPEGGVKLDLTTEKSEETTIN